MGLSSLWPLSSIEMYFSLVPSMDAALTWLTFAARLAATSSEASSGLLISCGRISARYASGEARPVGRRPLHRDAGRLPGRRDRPGERLVSRRVGGELAGQDLAAPPVQDAQPVRVGVGVDPAEDRPAGAGCRFGSHVSLRSFRARLDRADGTLTGRDRMRLFGSAVSLHAPIRSCGGLGSPRPARDMSGNEGSPVGASGMWGHRAVRI